ncbi:hypothetical protein ACP93_14220 [Xanthomonas sp. NCPPB 1128]|nr:hypothetical protein ACP93_14220 [Xanthomonas sp. NCPPB 1128]
MFLFFTAYLAVLVLLGQERAMDWGLSEDEMYPHEIIMSFVLAGGGTATWLLGLYRAHLAGSWRWFLACLFLWPVAFVYTLFFNTGRKADGSPQPPRLAGRNSGVER